MRRILSKLLISIPRPLPVKLSDFEALADRVISITGQFADKDSMKFALASILIHADSKFGALPDKYFIDRLVKSAANQIASQVFQDIKIAQEAARQAALTPKAEVTAQQEAAPSDVKKD